LRNLAPEVDSGPAFAWVLPVLLWITIVINGAQIVLIFYAALSAQLTGQAAAAANAVGPYFLLYSFWPAVRLAGAAGLLKAQRWGLHLCVWFALLPSLWHAFYHGFDDPVDFCFTLIPTVLIVLLVLIRWEEFE
jgi:hypothetical protein